MTNAAPSTLFDRLVARTIQPAREIDAPREPLFDRFEATMSSAPAPVPRSIASPPAPAPVTSVSARNEEAAHSLPLTTSALTAKVEPATRSPRIDFRSPEANPPPTRLAEPPRPSAPPERPRVIRETRTLRETEFRELRVPVPVLAEPRQAVGKRPTPGGALELQRRPEVHPDLPPTISFHYAPPEPARTVEHSEPDIHVTIGRLEIHAGAQQQRPPARKQRESKSPSLDEYLAARRGGRT